MTDIKVTRRGFLASMVAMVATALIAPGELIRQAAVKTIGPKYELISLGLRKDFRKTYEGMYKDAAAHRFSQLPADQMMALMGYSWEPPYPERVKL